MNLAGSHSAKHRAKSVAEEDKASDQQVERAWRRGERIQWLAEPEPPEARSLCASGGPSLRDTAGGAIAKSVKRPEVQHKVDQPFAETGPSLKRPRRAPSQRQRPGVKEPAG
jgi:hypothetical protein